MTIKNCYQTTDYKVRLAMIEALHRKCLLLLRAARRGQ